MLCYIHTSARIYLHTIQEYLWFHVKMAGTLNVLKDSPFMKRWEGKMVENMHVFRCLLKTQQTQENQVYLLDLSAHSLDIFAM